MKGTGTEMDVVILDRSLSGEYFGIAAYEAAIGSGLLAPEAERLAVKFQNDHREHARILAETIVRLGGTPSEPSSDAEYAKEFPPLGSQEDVIRYAIVLESQAASAHLASVPRLSTPELAELAASISGDEAMHWAVLLGAIGEDPVPVSFIPLPKTA